MTIYSGRMYLGWGTYCCANRKLIRLAMSPTNPEQQMWHRWITLNESNSSVRHGCDGGLVHCGCRSDQGWPPPTPLLLQRWLLHGAPSIYNTFASGRYIFMRRDRLKRESSWLHVWPAMAVDIIMTENTCPVTRIGITCGIDSIFQSSKILHYCFTMVTWWLSTPSAFQTLHNKTNIWQMLLTSFNSSETVMLSLTWGCFCMKM